MLDIKNSEELGAIQVCLNDVAELLPPEKSPDITEICVALEKYSTEIIDYDKLVELLNNYIDKTDETNKQAIEEYVMSMDEDSRQEIHDIVGDIASGDITEHFKTETLATIRKKYRIEKNN